LIITNFSPRFRSINPTHDDAAGRRRYRDAFTDNQEIITMGVWVLVIDENVRGVILLRRWRSGKWKGKGFVKEGKV
jgi:hypothetical protein